MTIKPAIRQTRPNKDGKCNIKLAIGNKMHTAYISTPFDVFPSEWNNGIVVNHPQAGRINRFIAALCEKCLRIGFNLPYMEMSATELRIAITERVQPLIGQILENTADKYDPAMDRKSNKEGYRENRNAYHDRVVKMFSEGMTAKEILKEIPAIGRSTIYRWYDDYCKEHSEAIARKSPKAAVQTIASLRDRISQLESEIEKYKNADSRKQHILDSLGKIDKKVCELHDSIQTITNEL